MAIKFPAARFTDQEALLFHSQGKPGKLEITPTKPLTTQRDLSLAYSPNGQFLAGGGGLNYRVRYLSQGDCIVWAVHILGVR